MTNPYEDPARPETSPYGTPPYGQPGPGQQPYGQQGYAAQPYGSPAAAPQAYSGGVPARPGGVTTAAVFGFIFGALGVLVTLGLFIGSAFLGSFVSSLGDSSTVRAGGSVVTGVVVFFGVLALAWTVLTIWGSVYAVTGRSRVLLIVMGSISIATTGFSFFGSFGGNSNAAGIVIALVLFAMSILIVVLLSMRPAADFFAAHRLRRAR